LAGTVLYIDDSPELPRGTAEELSRLGFRLRHTRDPEEGLRWAREGLSRMVLLEVLLPDHDGWAILEELGTCTGSAGELPVLVLTRGERTPDLYSRAVEAGASDFLSKPVLRAELLAAVLECAERSESGRDLETDCGGPSQSIASAFSGELSDVPLTELLLRLRRVGANGVLLLQFEGETRGIQLRNGSPVAAATNRGFETLEDFLVRTKEISGEEHEVVTGAAAGGAGSTSEVLVELSLLDEEGVRDALARRAAEPLLEGFEWSTGSFRFESGKLLKSKQTLEFPQSPGQLLLEGCLRWLSSRQVRQLLDLRAAHYVSKEDRPLYTLGDLDALLVAGLVEVHPEPVLELGVELEPMVEEHEEAEAIEPAAPSAARPPEPASEAPGAAQPGLPVEPARLSPDPQKGQAGDDSAARRLEAERWFQEGAEALAAQRFEKALEAFGMATHLDPSQGLYHAHLGYALHMHQPRNALVRREALEHIAKGVKLAPDAWKPLVFLGRVFRAGDDFASARKVIGRALRLDPDCAAARAEMRLLKAAEQPKSTGMVDRVRGWFKGRG
jgi:CheY-like chemotaxis protein/tetratricopeptide (TPR) repeat protein